MANKFCVITTNRSGSTWLATLLDSHPEIKSFEEPFVWRKDRPNWTDPTFPTYYDFKVKGGRKSPLTLFQYLNILNTYPSDTPFGAIGFKMMYQHVWRHPGVILKFLQDRYRIIHLVRQNHLDILISLAARKQHQVAHTEEVQTKTKQVTLDISSLKKNLRRLERRSRRVKFLLKWLPSPVLEITYESMVTDQHQVLCSVVDFLGVDSESITFESKLKRLNKGTYASKIANYDQVVETLRGTSYHQYLKLS